MMDTMYILLLKTMVQVHVELVLIPEMWSG